MYWGSSWGLKIWVEMEVVGKSGWAFLRYLEREEGDREVIIGNPEFFSNIQYFERDTVSSVKTHLLNVS